MSLGGVVSENDQVVANGAVVRDRRSIFGAMVAHRDNGSSREVVVPILLGCVPQVTFIDGKTLAS